jgi:hypothetical protein
MIRCLLLWALVVEDMLLGVQVVASSPVITGLV